MRERIGFIGVGLMGHGMAKNLIAAGYPLVIMGHRNRAPVEDLVSRGAREAPSPKALAEETDVVLLCVNGSPQVEDLLYRDDGLLAGLRAGMAVVDCSTSDPVSTRRIAVDLEGRGIHFADAPVTRAPRDAEAGRLNSLVGADQATFARIRPLIEAYSETVTHFGGVGAGHTAKLINNFVTCGTAALLAEGMAAAAAGGVDMRKLYHVMRNGAADSGTLRKMIEPFLDGDLSGHAFAIKNAHKDVGYYRSFAQATGLRGRMIDCLAATYTQAVEMGLGDKLMASLVEMHETLTGLSIVPGKERKPPTETP